MTTLPELVLAMSAAMGLLGFGWLLIGKIFSPVGKLGAPMYIVVQGKEAGVGLEHTVTTLTCFCGRELTDCPILLVDAGLNEEGQAVAKLLLKRWPELCLCKPEEIINYIT